MAQSLQILSANAPGIYCRFSPNCSVTPVEQSDSFTPTNVAATCVLQSRSFSGNTMDSKDRYGYEYRIILNSAGATETNVLTVDSLTLDCGAPDYFSFGLHASNQVWVVSTGGPGDVGPSSAESEGDVAKKTTFYFSPPVTLTTPADQSSDTYYFGMMSDGAPRITTAILSGTAQELSNAPVGFKALLQAQTP